ncbi:Hypothetical protein CINCED_3A008047 [Cinara cedri]|uniref:Uncharacterized protein n=1 Tax=Cinara cedri TaxID=506608 RepID=A0A5E4MBT7_9HEMI|nr:Hypothetical protein CINCED_3A008047 [Cinara cedri]
MRKRQRGERAFDINPVAVLIIRRARTANKTPFRTGNPQAGRQLGRQTSIKATGRAASLDLPTSGLLPRILSPTER